MVNYKFYRSDNKVIALSSFAGKTVKGTAKCDPSDTFSAEFGEKLAAARCDVKVATKRFKNARAKLYAANEAFEKAKKHFMNMSAYYDDSAKRLTDADNEVKKLLSTIEV